MSNVPELDKLIKLVNVHNSWRGRDCINMIASENITSPLVNALYISDMMHRYAEGLPFKRYYQGTRYIDEIEVYASELLSRLFNV
ncbi:MAG: serine hydroxymethyltransferase, partial [Thermoprotei archaeon]